MWKVVQVWMVTRVGECDPVGKFDFECERKECERV
jgi:hypothetical protein